MLRTYLHSKYISHKVPSLDTVWGLFSVPFPKNRKGWNRLGRWAIKC